VHVLEISTHAHSHICYKLPRVAKSLEVRFWAKVQKTETCWLWTAHKAHFGYGEIKMSTPPYKNLRAHRVSWELHFGPIPPGAQVLHHCDNPACVRPDHLFLGSDLDNQRDAIAKGRRPVVPKGLEASWTINPRRKFTDDEVRQIRTLYDSQKHWPRNKTRPYSLKGLASMFRTSFEDIGHIVNRRVYKNVV
jgi:hypothetical protein